MTPDAPDRFKTPRPPRRVAVHTHAACLEHAPPPGHPESPARLSAVLTALRDPALGPLDWREAPAATDVQLARVHPPEHVAAIEAREPARGAHPLDPDTWLSKGSVEAARRAAGAVVAAVDAVVGGELDAAFCAVRPPGHHAEPDAAMGFCVWNNAGVGARHAQAVHGLARVAIVDFDVHHGNGGQRLAEADPTLFYASIHQADAYPGTGLLGETGPAGNVVNAPVPAGTGSRAWRAAFETRILPALEAFGPELVIVSAGFDAHRSDPLAGLMLEEEDFAWATRALLAASAGKLVSTLEGGYHIAALGRCARAHVAALIAGEGDAGGANPPN
jgi:acetoin utilization deacetylase AcuC-like enzyme